MTVELVSLALFLASGRARRHALVVAPAMYVLFVVSIGYSLGELGGPDLARLTDAALAVLPPVLLPLRLPARLAVTAAVAVALMGSFRACLIGLPAKSSSSCEPGKDARSTRNAVGTTASCRALKRTAPAEQARYAGSSL